ncbi:hypothetical protein [Priestia megaterium]|uniref:hypothetical protein n=1 Tax=Priestia megaterium TaxID=1404 RepID=UPI003CC549F1
MSDYFTKYINRLQTEVDVFQDQLFENRQLLNSYSEIMRDIRRDTIITQLKLVCPPQQYKEVNLDDYDISTIEFATEYVRCYGFSLKTSLKYAAKYKHVGLAIFNDMIKDFHFKEIYKGKLKE